MKKAILLLTIFFLFFNLISSEEQLSHSHYGLGLGIGFNNPLFFKLSVYGIGAKGIGFELSALTNSRWKDNNDNYYDNIDDVTAEETFGDEKLSEIIGKTIIFGNIIYSISSKVFLFTGPGFGTKQKFHEYYDSTHILGDHGKYWVEASEKGDNWVTFDFGVKIIPSKIFVIDLSYVIEPSTFIFGMGMNFNHIFF